MGCNHGMVKAPPINNRYNHAGGVADVGLAAAVAGVAAVL
jgi:hypothetical protein